METKEGGTMEDQVVTNLPEGVTHEQFKAAFQVLRVDRKTHEAAVRKDQRQKLEAFRTQTEALGRAKGHHCPFCGYQNVYYIPKNEYVFGGCSYVCRTCKISFTLTLFGLTQPNKEITDNVK